MFILSMRIHWQSFVLITTMVHCSVSNWYSLPVFLSYVSLFHYLSFPFLSTLSFHKNNSQYIKLLGSSFYDFWNNGLYTLILLLYIQAQLFLWKMLPGIYVNWWIFKHIFHFFPDNPVACCLKSKEEASDLPRSMLVALLIQWNML